MGDRSPREGSRHPGGVRVVLKNGERADWASKMASGNRGSGTRSPWETWRVKIMDIWGQVGDYAYDRGSVSGFPLFSLKGL